jgi:hypothetical protein
MDAQIPHGKGIMDGDGHLRIADVLLFFSYTINTAIPASQYSIAYIHE